MSSNKISGKELVAALLLASGDTQRECLVVPLWQKNANKKAVVTPTCQKLTIDLLMSILSDLQSVTKALQAENRTVLDVRDLFDEVIKTYPQTKNRLGENASIIHDNVFEIAVQKILKGSEEELTPDESMKVTGLRNETSPMEGETKTGEERDADAGLSLAEKALSDDVLCPQRLQNLHS
ncbi:hypothetical protein IV203_027601 [Nitzschia inconspicua]|uniref:Uncharacterized protein n=1 Tax=Nitzschia inconspicua TaxID=303405 RepID=A0A9K3LXZ9_9STRA|nr:hypothetical protein IV203_027601 [Nitzschia inconspicua]